MSSTDILLEEIRAQMGAVLEIVTDSHKLVSRIPKIEGDIEGLTADIRVIKAAVTDTNHDLKLLERRVEKLEAHT